LQFNSFIFAFFFTAVFLLYWLIGSKRWQVQNLLLIAAGAVFYGKWDWRFLILLYTAAIVDFLLGLKLGKETVPQRRRLWLSFSLVMNIGLLVIFKYLNFFIQSFIDTAQLLGWSTDAHTLRIIMPVGISFFTFMRLSYIIDLYRKQIEPCRNFFAFIAFSAFFPLLLAGPIERAKRLLPQFQKTRAFDSNGWKDGGRLILWGLFKKLVIADNLSPLVNAAFSNCATQSGIDLAIGALLFTVQIYADFSGYSDMAMGIGKLLGFKIMRNFAYPYFSRDIAEFWRRWHISMSSWFRDYVYTPLSWHISLNDRWRRFRTILITFTVSGLWHGANWTFLVWGFLNGLFFTPLVFGKAPEHESRIAGEGRIFPSLREFAAMAVTFLMVVLAWIVFRANSLTHAIEYFAGMFSHPWLAAPTNPGWLAAGLSLLVLEWFTRHKTYALDVSGLPLVLRWGIYHAVILAIVLFGYVGVSGFIYVQF
jgi:alginate O-acetyltransferase complex protein AlgI